MPSVAVAVIASINDDDEEEEAEEEVLGGSDCWRGGSRCRARGVTRVCARHLGGGRGEAEAEALLAVGLGDARWRCSNEARGAVCTRAA